MNNFRVYFKLKRKGKKEKDQYKAAKWNKWKTEHQMIGQNKTTVEEDMLSNTQE